MATQRLRRGQWTFAPASKQITFGGVTGFDVIGLVEIWHVPSGRLIYDAYDDLNAGGLGYTAVTGNVVTLAYDTSAASPAMSASDALRIIYDDQAVDGLTMSYAVSATGPQAGFKTTGYGSVELEISGTTSGLVAVVEFSNDPDSVLDANATWRTAEGSVPSARSTVAQATSVTASNPKRCYPVTPGTRCRVNVQSYSSGAGVVAAVLRTAPYAPGEVYVANTVNTTLASAGTNRSGTVGTSATPLMAANASRRGWKVKNDSASDIWINFYATATAAAGSGNIKIAANGGYLASEPGFVETGAMSAIAGSAGLAVSAFEW